MQIARLVQKMYQEEGESVEIIDCATLDHDEATGKYGDSVPPIMKSWIDKLNVSDGIVFVVPEYNGSYPGILKYFIDHFKYPDTFEFRPVAFIGIGGRFGGLRPVEHLQGVFGYRNAFLYPERVFIFDIWGALKTGDIIDQQILGFMRAQVKGFRAFCSALSAAGLDANARLKARAEAASTASSASS